MRVEDLAQGKILVAPRANPDVHFAKSVILLAQHSSTGGLGLMLQYRADVTIQKALDGVKGADGRRDPVYVGGPVELPIVLGLERAAAPPLGAKHVIGDLYLITAKPVIGAAISDGRPASELRVFLGYSGWGPGQLEREVRHSGWYIFDFDEKLVFDEHPETLWDRLIERTERRVARAQMR